MTKRKQESGPSVLESGDPELPRYDLCRLRLLQSESRAEPDKERRERRIVNMDLLLKAFRIHLEVTRSEAERRDELPEHDVHQRR